MYLKHVEQQTSASFIDEMLLKNGEIMHRVAEFPAFNRNKISVNFLNIPTTGM